MRTRSSGAQRARSLARTAAVSPERRSEIARMGGLARHRANLTPEQRADISRASLVKARVARHANVAAKQEPPPAPVLPPTNDADVRLYRATKKARAKPMAKRAAKEMAAAKAAFDRLMSDLAESRHRGRPKKSSSPSRAGRGGGDADA